MGLVLRELYRVGPGGVRITWSNGSVSEYTAHTVVMLDRMPLKIEGRLYRLSREYGQLGYEAPALEPVK